MRRLFPLLTPLGWLASALVLAAVVALGWWFVTEPGRQRQRAAEAEVSAKLSDARTKSAADAISIQDGASDAAAASEQLSRESADAIRNAPGADQRLDPGLNRAGRERLCRRAAYRDHPDCVQLSRGAEPSS